MKSDIGNATGATKQNYFSAISLCHLKNTCTSDHDRANKTEPENAELVLDEDNVGFELPIADDDEDDDDANDEFLYVI